MRTLSMIPLLLMSSIAAAEGDQKPLTSGEFFDRLNGASTAHTLEKGEFAYHPLFHASAYGLSDNMDVKFPTLGLIGGPGIAVEYAFIQDDDMAVSVGAGGGGSWDFASYSGGAVLRYTKSMGDNRLNVGVGGDYSQITISTLDSEGNEISSSSSSSFEVPIDLGYDLVTSEVTTLTFSTHIKTLALIEGEGVLAIPHFGWAHGFGKKFRLALGVNLPIGGLSQEIVDSLAAVDIDMPKSGVLPLPHFQMWWKF